ncbi:MAG TPA: MmgE/PrpD family protein [Candidatus Enterocloster excrementigallinarum]|uniref:MmgE/PrpD family protein n=1 Tax=Candidatus Enterocloster excrementigallinarum TaxID=2838558 RepID=A0A9D2TEN6_9FIRM|nr:MmgE/PrpD family protein [Candidatus Enterocloster excrementigallinarum]
MPKRYNTPHRSRVVKTRLSEDEYADFTARLAPYGISQSEFLRQAIRRATIRPIIHVSAVNDTYGTAVQLTDNPYPENPYAAKFSLQYCIAAAIILKDLSDRAFTQENITNPNIKELMKKIQVRICPELDEAFRLDPNQWSHRLTITLKNGEVITKQIDYPIGDFKNPFDSAMADRKFLTLTEDVLGNSTSSRLLENIHNLDSLEDINILFS